MRTGSTHTSIPQVQPHAKCSSQLQHTLNHSFHCATDNRVKQEKGEHQGTEDTYLFLLRVASELGMCSSRQLGQKYESTCECATRWGGNTEGLIIASLSPQSGEMIREHPSHQQKTGALSKPRRKVLSYLLRHAQRAFQGSTVPAPI